MMSLISNLRGGQQKYMPLLLSKINDTMPNGPGYSLTSMASSSHDTDIYGGSEQAGSSNSSSPYASPLGGLE
jgi:hypothetical protein